MLKYQCYKRNSKRAVCNYQVMDATLRLLLCLATFHVHPSLNSCMLHAYHFLIVCDGNTYASL